MKRKLHHKLYFWHKITDNALLAILVSGLFTLIFGGMAHVYFKVQNGFTTLENQIVELVDADEDLYVLCKTFIKNPNNPTLNSQNLIFQIHSRIENKLNSAINQYYAMNRFMSDKTRTSVNEITCWNNILFEAGANICKLNLKNPNHLDVWRDSILTQIEIDKNSHQKIIHIVKDSFSHAKGLFVKDAVKIARDKCDLQKISNY